MNIFFLDGKWGGGAKTKLIFKKRKPHPFVISNRPEEELVKHMGAWAVVKIWGGPVLTMACVFYLYTVFG